MDINSKIWQGKNVLITGHTGFKGSWLVFLLKELGAEVYGLSLMDEKQNPSLYKDSKVQNELSNEFYGDIRDKELVKKVFEQSKPDYIFHLAAQAFVRESVRNPIDTFSSNIIGSANVLASALSYEFVQGVLIATTDKVYKNSISQIPFKESDELGGDDPYSSSKASVELVVNALRNSNNKYDIPVSTARAGNVIGGGDWGAERLIPDIVKSYINNETLNLRNPNSVRPWQYILDCLYGYIKLAQAHILRAPNYPITLNFGPSESLSVIDLLNIFKLQFPNKLNFTVSNSEISEKDWLQLNPDEAKKVLGWRAIVPQREAVKLTANWYSKYLNGEDARQLIHDEINNYKIFL